MDALLGANSFATSPIYQIGASSSSDAQQASLLIAAQGRSATTRHLSIVGYDQSVLLYEAIKEHHVLVSGRRLSKSARFGGDSKLEMARDDVLNDTNSIEAYLFAYGSMDMESRSDRERTIREQEYQDKLIRTLLGQDVYIMEDRGLFQTIIALKEEFILSLASAFGIDMDNIHDKTDHDLRILKLFIPAIREHEARQHGPGSAPGRVGGIRHSDTMREAEAANKIHMLKMKVAAGLSVHYHSTRLTRRALQVTGYLPHEPANIDGFSVSTLQNILDYLTADISLRESITTSALQSIGGPSPPRTRTICLDPDAEIAAILRSSRGLEYEGDSFEKLMCLIPLGTALAKVVVIYFQPTVNTEIHGMVESLRDLTFVDTRRRLSLAAGYAQLSQILSAVSRSGMAFNVLGVYRHIARAMNESTESAHDGGTWRALCYDTIRTYQSNQVNSFMPRGVLDDTMSQLRDIMDREADYRGLEMTFSTVATTTKVLAMEGNDLDCRVRGEKEWGSGEALTYGTPLYSLGYEGDDDSIISGANSEGDVPVVARVNAANRACDKCGASIAYSTDFCATCSSFQTGTAICTLCRTPRRCEPGIERVCRNFGTAMACDGKTFVAPNEDDKRRAQRAHTQRGSIMARRSLNQAHGGAAVVVAQRSSSKSASVSQPVPAQAEATDPAPVTTVRFQKGKGKEKGHWQPASIGGGIAPQLSPSPVKSGGANAINQPSSKQCMVAAKDVADQPGVQRIYNQHGYDVNGSRGPGLPAVTTDPATLEAPFIYSVDGLTERGRDKYGSVPEAPTPEQRRELDGLHDAACQQHMRRISAVSALVSQTTQFCIATHVVPAQDEHILALCDLEKAGMMFNTVKDANGDNVSWLAITGGGGVSLSRRAGLFYLHGYKSQDGGMTIGEGGDIRFLVDTGAQASLVGSHGITLLTKFTAPKISMTAAGGHPLVITHSGELTMRYQPGMCAVTHSGESGGAECPRNLFIGEVRSSGGIDDTAVPPQQRRGRYAHIDSVDALHYRFGFTDPAVFKAIHGMTLGTQPVRTPAADRYVSTTMALAASRRRMIRHESIPCSIAHRARPGERASVDFTRQFQPDMDGYVAAVIFMDYESRELFSYPTFDKTGESFVAALRAYREHIRTTKPGMELKQLVGDCDVSWTTTTAGGEFRITEVVRDYLESTPRSLAFTRSPPHTQALNPVEGACTRLYYLMNFFLHMGMLSMVAWYDMLRAAVYAFNVTPHLRSGRIDLRSKTPYELSRGTPPDLSMQVAHPGQMVAILTHGSKSSAGVDRSVLAYYICPSSMLLGSGWLCREYKSRKLRETGHMYVMPPFKGAGAPEASVASGGIMRSDLAPRSVALYHALDSELFRGGHGVMTPDAAICVDQARELFRASESMDDGKCVLWIDGVTGLAKRLVVIAVPEDVGGSLGLADDDTVTMVSATGDSLPTPEVPALANETVSDNAPSCDLHGWFKSLPDTTPVKYEQGSKAPGSKSGIRYSAYKGVKTLGNYRRIQESKYAWPDFKYDLAHNIVSLSPKVWASRLKIAAAGATVVHAVFVSAEFSPSEGDSGAAADIEQREVALSLKEMTEIWAQQASDLIDGGHQVCAISADDIAGAGGYSGLQHDRLQARAESVAVHDGVMQRTLKLEAYEDGKTHPAIVGGPVVDRLAAEGISDYRVNALTASAPKMQTIKQMKAHPLWNTTGGFKEKLREELTHVIEVKKALVLVSNEEYRKDMARYGERCETKNILTPATEKLMADGSHARLKVRLVIADIRGVFQIERTFSATVNDESIRFLESFLLGRPGAVRRVLDVKGAYFEGKVPTPEMGGRVLYARVPAGWKEFGYSEHSESTGKPNYFKVVGNVPGRQDAGVIWQDEYDSWLFGQNFTQSVVDRRVFFKSISRAVGGIGLFVIGVFVDDNWTHCECQVEWDAFYAKWKARFMPSLTNELAGRDFVGVTYDDKPDGSVELSCEKLLTALAEMVHLDIEGKNYDTPMASDSLTAMRELPTAERPLLGDTFVHRARQILGLILYVVRCARPESSFAAVAISQHIGFNLTQAVWDALIRLAVYLVRTPFMRLIYRPHWKNGQEDFVCNCDSSCINMPTDLTSFDQGAAGDVTGQGPMGASMGGFANFFADSGAFQWEVFSPRKLALSSAGSELTMASWAGKSILAWRMLQRELSLAPLGPTVLEMDAKAVLDGVKMERVTRQQRYLAARLATLRMWVLDLVLTFRKTPSADMRADALSKPVQPAEAFHRLASLLLTGRENGST